MEIRKVIADNIRFIRIERKMSQEALAAKAKISISYLGYIERAEKAITVVKLEQLAKALKVKPSQLLEPEAYRQENL
jgi:transcriptional regulator with XRE-family HTH domain